MVAGNPWLAVGESRARTGGGPFRRRDTSPRPVWTTTMLSTAARICKRLKRVIDFISVICLHPSSFANYRARGLYRRDRRRPACGVLAAAAGKGWTTLRLYKFRTMHPAHDAQGNRVPTSYGLRGSAGFCGEAGLMNYPSFTTSSLERCPS